MRAFFLAPARRKTGTSRRSPRFIAPRIPIHCEPVFYGSGFGVGDFDGAGGEAWAAAGGVFWPAGGAVCVEFGGAWLETAGGAEPDAGGAD